MLSDFSRRKAKELDTVKKERDKEREEKDKAKEQMEQWRRDKELEEKIVMGKVSMLLNEKKKKIRELKGMLTDLQGD